MRITGCLVAQCVVEAIQNGGTCVGVVTKCEKGKGRGARVLGPAVVRVQLAVVVAEYRVKELVSLDSSDQAVPPEESGGIMAVAELACLVGGVGQGDGKMQGLGHCQGNFSGGQ